MMQMKVCSKCGNVKRRASYGLICDPCNRARALAYRQANLEKVREKDRKRAAAIPVEVRRSKHKNWRDANREHVRRQARIVAKRLYEANPEKYRALAREWHQSNKGKSAAMRADWYARNADWAKEYARLYRLEHRERVTAKVREWREKNPDAAERYARIARDELRESYVRRVLTQDEKILQPKDIPQSLIEAKRVQLQIKRLIREKTK